jgi:transcription antitermination factor NusA-like protein
MMRFANRIDGLSDKCNDTRLEGEKIFIMRKIDEVQNEIFQLENNIQFLPILKCKKRKFYCFRST